MKSMSLILLSLFALCSLDGSGKTIHRPFQGGCPSVVADGLRVVCADAMDVISGLGVVFKS